VVGVQGHVHRVLLGDDVRELGQRRGARDHVLDRRIGEVLRAAGRDWMIPSLSASVNPRRAAFSVWLEVTLIEG
jgi:hypothetical protein